MADRRLWPRVIGKIWPRCGDRNGKFPQPREGDTKTYFILDEAASLSSNLTCLEDAIDKYRAYGIRLLLFYQTPAQLKKCFTKGQDETLMANATQVFFAVQDNTAEYVSNRLGEETIIVESGGGGSATSRSISGMQENATSSTNCNRNWQQLGRKLLKPDEVLRLNERVAITFVPGLPPIATILTRYYERQIWQGKGRAVFTLMKSIAFALLCGLGLLITFLFLEQSNVRHLPTDLRRSKAVRYPRTDGIGERTFQW